MTQDDIFAAALLALGPPYEIPSRASKSAPPRDTILEHIMNYRRFIGQFSVSDYESISYGKWQSWYDTRNTQ